MAKKNGTGPTGTPKSNRFDELAHHEAAALLINTAIAMANDGHGHIAAYNVEQEGKPVGASIFIEGFWLDDAHNITAIIPPPTPEK